MKAESTGLIILAAGGSRRLGRPKQLLPYEGITLLKHSIQAGIESIAGTIIVVLGADADIMMKDIKGYKVNIVVNNDWQEGIASSIRLGLQTLLQTRADITGVVIMLCDQPYVSASLIDNIIKSAQNTGKRIIASSYGDVKGVPAWFHASLFPELMQLKGDMGARALIQEHIHEVASIAFPQGSVDIDTEKDYKALVEATQSITDESNSLIQP